jgi:putative transposase
MGSVRHHPVVNNATMLVTTITRHRRPIFDDPAIAREAIETLYRVQQLYPFWLFAFVMMPNHCHFLMRVPAPNSITQMMKQFKSGVSHNVGLGPQWQSRYHVEIATQPQAAKAYIHMNPVVAGLVDHPHDFCWSSASGKWDISPLST